MTSERSDRGVGPRRAALALIQSVTADGRLLSETATLTPLAALSAPDRARAQRLALQTLRWLDRADDWLKPCLRKPPPLAVMNALRLGAVEIGQGAAAHGVVNDIVTIVGAVKRTAQFRGLVNAVLRRLGRDGPAAWDLLDIPRLPMWLRVPLVDAWGDAAMSAMERAHAAGAPLDLTAKGDPAEVAAITGGTLLPTGSVRLADAGQVSALPGYAEGLWWVQDAAAALPVRLMAPRPGERVIDLCAAPGGKTLQLAAAGAQVTAVDASAARMTRLCDNLARTGLVARTLVADARDITEGGYDNVLLDAPCSATGTIRRHPDLPHARDGREIAELVARQTRMIDHALTLLRPGGRLVYCTCSLLPDEGEAQIAAALQRHPGLAILPPDPTLPGIEPGWLSPEGGLRLRPDHWAGIGGIDGFYIARLQKPA
ncbi:MAG: RsmB/NOP family class I SAM-dependent RNA methyltransferase [Rubellimicrobium sp.]|nr:RsmB/NOP family class I SAM-dependent RNA methyltransferase [Rubellimicrobium sp.]